MQNIEKPKSPLPEATSMQVYYATYPPESNAKAASKKRGKKKTNHAATVCRAEIVNSDGTVCDSKQMKKLKDPKNCPFCCECNSCNTFCYIVVSDVTLP